MRIPKYLRGVLAIAIICLAVASQALSSISRITSAGPSAQNHVKLANSRNVQTQPATGSGSGFWLPVGPLGTDYASGEMRVVAVNSTDANTLYVGAAEGGVWKTANGGSTWIPITDTQLIRSLPSGQQKGTLSIGAITIDSFPRPNVIYVGTGDLTPVGRAGPALGVFKSSTGGTSWTPLGVSLTNLACANTDMSNTVVNKIVVRDGTPITVFAASKAGIFEYPEDGSDCWRRVGGGLPTTGDAALDLAMDRLSGTMYAAFEHQGIWKSTDTLGQQWMQLTTGLPTPGSFGRIFLAFRSYGSGDLASKALYAGFNYAGTLRLFKFSFDSSNDWTELPTPPQNGQLEFDVTMALGLHSSNFVYLGLTKLFRSTDGGTSGTWADISCVPPTTDVTELGCVTSGGTYAMHADFHDIVFAPLGSFTQTSSVYEIFFLAEDGGIMKGIVDNTGAITWVSLTKGLQVGQCGTMGLAPSSTVLFTCGLWHVGTVVVDTGVQTTFGIGGAKDSYHATIDAATGATVVYDDCDASGGGSICRARTPLDNLSGNSNIEGICPVGDFSASPGRAMWSDPYRPGHLLALFGGTLVRTEVANTASAFDLSSGCAGANNANPAFTGLWRVLNPPGVPDITTMAFRSPLLDGPTGVADPIYYIGTSNGDIWRGSPEVGWQKLCGCGPLPVFGIAAEFFVNEAVFTVFGGSAGPGRIKELTRIGTTWSVEDIDTGFTPDLSVSVINSVVAKPALWLEGSTTVFIGTDQGVFVGRPEIINFTPTWVWTRSPGVPNVEVTDLEAHQSLLFSDRSLVVRAGTYGRGVFEFEDPILAQAVPIYDKDWSDFDNDGKVTILDVASAAFLFDKPSNYWDLNLNGRTDITEIALVAFEFDKTFGQTQYPSQGFAVGTMDPAWAGLCRVFPASPERTYCYSTSFHNLFFPNCPPFNNQVSCISRFQPSPGGPCSISFHAKDGFSFRTEMTGITRIRATSGTVSTFANLTSLAPGQETVSTIPDPTNCGQGLVQLTLDDSDVLVESNEGDNTLQFSLVA